MTMANTLKKEQDEFARAFVIDFETAIAKLDFQDAVALLSERLETLDDDYLANKVGYDEFKAMSVRMCTDIAGHSLRRF